MAQNLHRGTPARLLVLLALLMGIVMVSAWRDALQRPVTGTVRYPTALGDSAYFTPGEPVRIQAGGQSVGLRATGEPLHRRDDRMFRLPLTASPPVRLYVEEENPGPATEPAVFARTAAGRFIRMKAEAGTDEKSASSPSRPSADVEGR